MANNTVSFESLPDAEAARLMAEKDGFILNGPKCTWFNQRQYTTSLDAAVGWLDRMGLRWERQLVNANYNDGVVIVYGTYSESFTESTDCPTSRALCNAGWAAVKAREAANG